MKFNNSETFEPNAFENVHKNKIHQFQLIFLFESSIIISFSILRRNGAPLVWKKMFEENNYPQLL
jgi:hypothetical protein